MQQARICLRIQPQLKAAEMLIADCSVHPAAMKEEIKPQ
jgi:hypothetical protein